MSGSNNAQPTLTVASPPTTADVAATILGWIGGESGVLTDINVGSQVRTDAEAVGSVVEMQGVIAQAQAFQAMVYATWAAFNIFPFLALPAAALVVFSTGQGANPPAAPSPINIPANTIVQTVGGTQFQTIAAAVIPTGGTSVNVSVQAVVAGIGGNVAAGAITQIASSLSYPLQVTNNLAATGGADAETPAQTMARFTAAVASLGLSTPVAIANGCIGVEAPGTSEVVKFATVYEPWILQVIQGVQNPTPGYTVFVDNGTGSASSNLLTQVGVVISGDQTLGEDGFRPAGVPYTVQAVSPVYCSVSVSGVAINPGLDTTLTTLTTNAVEGYFSALPFGTPADIAEILPAVANQVAGNVSSLSVQLLNVSGVVVDTVTALGYQRVILQNLVVTFN